MSEFGPTSNNPEEQAPRGEIIRRLTESEYNTPLTNGDTIEQLYTTSYGPKGEGWDVIFEDDVSLDDKLKSIETATGHHEFSSVVAGVQDEHTAAYNDFKGSEKSATSGRWGVIVVYEAGKAHYEQEFGEKD